MTPAEVAASVGGGEAVPGLGCDGHLHAEGRGEGHGARVQGREGGVRGVDGRARASGEQAPRTVGLQGVPIGQAQVLHGGLELPQGHRRRLAERGVRRWLEQHLGGGWGRAGHHRQGLALDCDGILEDIVISSERKGKDLGETQRRKADTPESAATCPAQWGLCAVTAGPCPACAHCLPPGLSYCPTDLRPGISAWVQVL